MLIHTQTRRVVFLSLAVFAFAAGVLAGRSGHAEATFGHGDINLTHAQAAPGPGTSGGYGGK